MFGPFPTNLPNAIQKGYLERAFLDALRPVLVFRSIADKDIFPARIGETLTRTRMGLMIPNITPLNPSTNTGLDNGLTPQGYSNEQYDLTVHQYPQLAEDINIPDDELSIASFAMQNAIALGIAQASALDMLARNALYDAYMSGNTVVSATLGSSGATVSLDDVRGFMKVMVSGNLTPVSNTNTMPVYINNTLYQIQAATIDVTNVSSAALTGGKSGTITATTSISTTNGTAGNVVRSVYSPMIIRPNGKLSTASLASSDLLNLATIQAGVAYLRNNVVQPVRGKNGKSAYNFYCDATSMSQLFSDPAFRQLTQGVGTQDPDYEQAWIYETLGCRFIQTTQCYVQLPQTGAPVPVSQTIHRPIMCGKGALIESMFKRGMDAVIEEARKNKIATVTESISYTNPFNINAAPLGQAAAQGFYLYLRHPLDRLGQQISQTSNYIGDFVVPTDSVTNSATVATASSAYYKRCVVFETA